MRMDSSLPCIGICDKQGQNTWKMKEKLITDILRRNFDSFRDETLTMIKSRDEIHRLDRLRWMTRYSDPYPSLRAGEMPELSRNEIRTLKGRTVLQLPRFEVNNTHLCEFAFSPGRVIGIRAC